MTPIKQAEELMALVEAYGDVREELGSLTGPESPEVISARAPATSRAEELARRMWAVLAEGPTS